jgi:signal transduction histidine kinase
MVTDSSESSRQRVQTDESLRVERAQIDDAMIETQSSVEALRRSERSSSDGELRRERDKDANQVAKLLPLEREQTDHYLLTERTRSDEALSNRDDFLAMVSHDLRGLLGGIVLCNDSVAETVSESSCAAAVLLETDDIRRYVTRMNRLIGDLVDIVSIDAGKLSVTRRPTDAAQLVDEAVGTSRKAAADKGVSLTAEVVERPLMAGFDGERVLQVLTNLLTNAVRSTNRGGSIVVRAESLHGQLLLSVSDTGCGLPSDKLEAIFERFWQADQDNRRGLGLGLYISRCIVEAHGGRIWAESTAGVGSRFSFSLGGSLRRVALAAARTVS